MDNEMTVKEKGKTISEKVRKSLLWTFSLLLFTSLSAETLDTVTYVDERGVTQTATDVTLVDTMSDDGYSNLKFGAGWYVVTGRIARAQCAITGGTVNLILADGAELIADPRKNDSSEFDARGPGFRVVQGQGLVIYGQKAGTGKLTAIAANCPTGECGAGIGGQLWESDCGTVTINGGTVEAKGDGGCAGIGGSVVAKSGDSGTGSCGTITINGGTVTATGGRKEAEGAFESLSGPGIGCGARGGGGSVTITGGQVKATGGAGAPDIGVGDPAISGCAVALSGGVFARQPEDGWCAEWHGVTANDDEATREVYPWAVARFLYPYRAWDAAEHRMTDAVFKVDALVTASTRTFEDGKWYAVANDVVINDGNNIKVRGSAHLVLLDGASLTVTKVADGKAAIDVPKNASLAIYDRRWARASLSQTVRTAVRASAADEAVPEEMAEKCRV